MGKATVVSANTNQKNNRGIDLVFRPDDKDRDWKVIDFSGKSKGLKSNDRIEISMEKDGNFWKITDLTKIHDMPNGASSGASSTAPTTASGGTWQPRKDDPETVKRIARSVALKAAVEVVLGMLSNGTLKKSASEDLVMGRIQDISAEFEDYLTLQKDYQITEPGSTEPDYTPDAA